MPWYGVNRPKIKNRQDDNGDGRSLKSRCHNMKLEHKMTLNARFRSHGIFHNRRHTRLAEKDERPDQVEWIRKRV